MSDPRQAAAMDEFVRHVAEPAGEAPEDRIQDEARRRADDEDPAAEAAMDRPEGATAQKEENR